MGNVFLAEYIIGNQLESTFLAILWADLQIKGEVGIWGKKLSHIYIEPIIYQATDWGDWNTEKVRL